MGLSCVAYAGLGVFQALPCPCTDVGAALLCWAVYTCSSDSHSLARWPAVPWLVGCCSVLPSLFEFCRIFLHGLVEFALCACPVFSEELDSLRADFRIVGLSEEGAVAT